ncbi:lipopolysaccharide transport system ATP-binding protein [Pseudobutyrivibrio sp. UC1225]|uniref:ABC transporter ATP-binding protein n=1 Tax=Pseudobutyrivibrio sp. UC1225 TaxID=1798185 RepID=UPI0008F007B7|nr:polysaccharide ABC transporter ATP-binding protein [Pseudobutyrivibrio sp. UC1225]SFN79045.1 lipopolysaccharide transport system ATP-binding protein [Pseudobutyrivibrio sp. UC1225]
MSDIAIKIENLRKQYMLGAIGGQTLNAELQSWWARKRGKEDPNLMIGQGYSNSVNSFYALDGINLEIKKGEAVGIIGWNGAGKSTLLKILSRVTAPTEGDIWIDGRIASMLEVGTGFHGELTGRENIYMNGAILGMTRKEVDEKIESIIDFSECRQFIDTPVKRYSSGMYVKLAFAVASHLDAEIMIMDEVLAVGDMAFQKKCLSKMGDEAHGGKTVLYVSHNMATIRNLCDRCIVLKHGKVVFDGGVEDAIAVYMDSNTDVSSAYIDNTLKDRGTRVDRLGSLVMMNNVSFKNKDRLFFSNQEEVLFDVEIESFVDLENLYMGISINELDNSPIGFDYVRIPDMKKGEKKIVSFQTEFKELPAGNYAMQFNLHRQNDMGGWDRSLDQTNNLPFRVEDCEVRLQWRKDWFGNVFFNALQVRE